MKRKILTTILILFFIYLFGYIFIRQTHIEIWEKDKKAYVIFPQDKILYYMYRPLSLIDGKITGIGIHIGPHQ
jgi:hypothetical protein